jgi:hypothetical protein
VEGVPSQGIFFDVALHSMPSKQKKTKRKLADDRGNFLGKGLTLLLDMQYYAEARHIKGTNPSPVS